MTASFAARKAILSFVLFPVLLAGCGDRSKIPVGSDYGAHPQLRAPVRSWIFPNLIFTVNVTPAVGWPPGALPLAAPGFTVKEFAGHLDHPRWLYVLPNGDVLVAETNGPPAPEDNPGIKGWIMKRVMAKVGAGVPSANRIVLLRDTNGDGKADIHSVFLTGLHSPFGMALVGDTLYVANTDGIVKFPYVEGETRIGAVAVKVTDLPAGPINHHWTKNVIASRDGKRLYATVGSNSNAAENGMDKEVGRAAIYEIDPASGTKKIFASGLRNSNGLAWNPATGMLWTTVEERDEIGSDLVPDYMTSVKPGGFYGWPYSYYGQHLDERVKPQRPDLVKKVIVPDYALGAHTSTLGLAFYEGSLFPERYRGGAFIGQHGSWNREPLSGYRVIFVPFKNGHPYGGPEPILTGFVNGKGEAMGRPVGVAVDKTGALLVADDVGNRIWRVTPASK